MLEVKIERYKMHLFTQKGTQSVWKYFMIFWLAVNKFNISIEKILEMYYKHLVALLNSLLSDHT